MTPLRPGGLRLFGHPMHVMLIHFPVALWPAHFALHVFADMLPAGVSAVGGFWLLVAGTLLGWLAAAAGALDLTAIWSTPGDPRSRPASIHACINGTVLTGFTVLAALESSRYPVIHHHRWFLVSEAVLLLAMLAGNYFGSETVWHAAGRKDC